MKIKKGFTLIETLVVLAIITILLSLSALKYTDIVESTKEKICINNCNELDKLYSGFLILENTEDSEALFSSFLKNYDKQICPKNGDISYDSDGVKCSIHHKNYEDDEEDVPYIYDYKSYSIYFTYA